MSSPGLEAAKGQSPRREPGSCQGSQGPEARCPPNGLPLTGFSVLLRLSDSALRPPKTHIN